MSESIEMTAILNLAPFLANIRELLRGSEAVDSGRCRTQEYGFGARDVPGPGMGE
jgi:hypothetical protein